MTADTAADRRRPRRRRRARSGIDGSRRLPYLLMAPAALYLVVFQGIPLLRELQLSFSQTSLLRPNELNFIGLENYRRLLADPGFRDTMVITLIYVVVCVTATIGIGLAIALMLNRAFAARGIVRALVIIPWAAPPVAVALIVTWMLNVDYGVVNRLLSAVGLDGWRQAWLDNPDTALPAILATTIWQLFPFTALVLLAALQAVSHDLIEASITDGANARQRFSAVTWPAIRPTVALLTLLMTIWSLRRFELIWLMTQGGPAGATNTLVIDLYRRAFQFNDLGQAAAIGMVGVVVALTVTIAYFLIVARAERREARR